MTDPHQIDAHPLVALPSALKSNTPRLPSEVGIRHPTGRMSRRALDTLVSIAEAVFSDNGEPPPQDRLLWLREELDDFMARGSGRGRFLFTAGSTVISIVGAFRGGRLPPFRNMSLERRVAALEKIEKGPLGGILIALRAILCLLYFEHPDAAVQLGLPLTREGGSFEFENTTESAS